MDKVLFVVIDENKFGTIKPETPNSMLVMAASFIRGACCDLLGNYPVPTVWGERVRMATEADFDSYRISSQGFKEDTERYEYIRE